MGAHCGCKHLLKRQGKRVRGGRVEDKGGNSLVPSYKGGNSLVPTYKGRRSLVQSYKGGISLVPAYKASLEGPAKIQEVRKTSSTSEAHKLCSSSSLATFCAKLNFSLFVSCLPDYLPLYVITCLSLNTSTCFLHAYPPHTYIPARVFIYLLIPHFTYLHNSLFTHLLTYLPTNIPTY